MNKTLLSTASILALLLASCHGTRQSQTRQRDLSAERAKQEAARTASAAEASARRSANTTSVSADGMSWGSMALPTGDEATSTVMLRKGVPQEVLLGTDFTYQLEVANLTQEHLEDVVVSESLPEKFKLTSSDPKMASTEGGVANWNVGHLGAGEKRTIRITGQATTIGDLKSCASVTYNSRVCSTIAVVQPAIELTKTAPSEVLMCDGIRVKYVVTNNGTGMARNIVISDKLPQNLETADRKPVRFTVDDLAAGASREFSIKLIPKQTGSFGSSAVASAAGNLNTKSQPATTLVRAPKIKITNEGPEQGFIGRNMVFTVKVKNEGDAPATNLVVEDSFPRGAKLVSASDKGRASQGKVIWNLNSLPPKGERTLTATFLQTTAGDLRTTAEAIATCAQSASASATVKLVGIPAILLEVVDVADPVAVGEQETYEIHVTNQGTAAGTGIKIECDLEDSMQFISAKGPTPGRFSDGTVTFGSLASLAPKGKTSWLVVVKATKESDSRFKVRLNSDQMTRPVEETEATNIYK